MKLPNQPRVLAATYNPVSNTKMISFLVDFPTVYLAELRTHRILTQGSLYEHMELDNFNMSANSARAIPTDKYVQKIKDNPFVPIWTTRQKGMQGGQTTDEQEDAATIAWNGFLNGKCVDVEIKDGNSLKVIDTVSHLEPGIIQMSEFLVSQGIHKQQANRILAPFAYTTCILSGTEWDNFFELRCPKYELENKIFKSRKEALRYFKLSEENLNVTDWQSINKSGAQPEFQVIAEMLYDLYQEAKWEESKYHIPFYDDIIKTYYKELDKLSSSNEEYVDIVMKISASMCAKLSYNTQDNEDTFDKHLERAQMLIDSKHPEPFAHQAVAMDEVENQIFQKRFLKKIELSAMTTENSPVNHVIEYKLKNNCELLPYDKNTRIVIEKGWCYNLRGFISQRYTIENF